jgi:hypothetical protein
MTRDGFFSHVRFVTRSWLPSLVAATILAACNNHGASLAGPDHALAVGAYHSLEFGDACGSELYPFCTGEGVSEMLEFRSDDPTIADIVLGKDHPRGDLARHSYYVLGKKAGQTSLTFKARFSDGSVREDSTSIQVKAPDSFKLAQLCGDDPEPANLLVALGNMDTFELDMLAGTDQLAGWLPGAVTADGLTELFDDEDWNIYVWQAPATPVVLPLQSGVVRKIDGTLTAFGPEQVTEIDLVSANPLSRAAFIQPGDFVVLTQVRVHGQAPCNGLPVELHSSTPSICSGPSGETVWMGDSQYGGRAAVYAEGNCVLSVAMPGRALLNTQTFPVFFVQAPPSGLQIPGFDTQCPVEGGTACAYGDDEVGVCQSGLWTLKSECPANQVCDYVPDSTPGCAAGASCARCRGLQ